MRSSRRTSPAVLRAAFLATLATVGAIAAYAATAPAATKTGDCTPGSTWPAQNAGLAAQVMSLINQHRASIGEGQLVTSPTLTASAVWKARHMANYNYFSHDDPAPPVARTAADRIATCGYTYSWGENIAEGYPDAQSVVNAWLNSPGHKANIENASFVATGVGVAQSAQSGAIYWVQDFGFVADSGSPPPPPTTTAPTTTAPPPPTTTTSTTTTTTTTTTGTTPTTTRSTTTTTTHSTTTSAKGTTPIPTLAVRSLRLSAMSVHVHSLRLVLATKVSAGAAAPASAYVKCSASIGRHELRVVVNVYRGNLAHCAWRLPAGLRHGTVARGSVTVKQGGLHARRVFKLPLR